MTMSELDEDGILGLWMDRVSKQIEICRLSCRYLLRLMGNSRVVEP